MSNQQSLISLLRRLWRHIAPRRRMQLAALGGLMLLGTVTEVVSLGMVLPFLGALTAPEQIFDHPWAQVIVTRMDLTAPQQLLLPLTVLFCLAAVLSGVTRLALLWGQMRLGHAIGGDLGATAYRITLYQPYSVHTERNSSEVISVLMNKITTIVLGIILPLLTLIISVFTVLTIAVFMFVVDPKLTAISFMGFGLFYVLVAYATKKRLLLDSERMAMGQNNVAKVVQEGLGGIRDVLIDGLQETYYRIYRQMDKQLRRAHGNITIIGGVPRPVIEAFGLVLIGWLAYSLADTSGSVANAIPILGALALAAQRLLPLVQHGYAGWASMLGGKASLSDVLSLLEQPLPQYSALPPPQPLLFNYQISLNNLCVSYGGQRSLVLRGIDLQIPRGSCIGFIGATGSGKSTLLDVVMGLLPPTSGTISIDGTIVDETARRAWQLNIAHVPQTIFLADTTIIENIAFGVPPEVIDRGRVRQAAQQAQIAATIESWQHGYETFVGERGLRLSGGQRQRIGIARALYKHANVLVLDEATSALDNDTESAVMDSIDSLGKELTILIVAHRITTLKKCDQIIELRGGKVHRIGTYQEIIGTSIGALQEK